MIVCYLCGEPVDASDGSGDHVIPRTLLGVNGGGNMYRGGGAKMYHGLGGSLSP